MSKAIEKNGIWYAQYDCCCGRKGEMKLETWQRLKPDDDVICDACEQGE